MSSRLRATGTSSGSVHVGDQTFETIWDAIEDDLGKRERLKMHSTLMFLLTQRIRAKGWTQKDAAKQLRVTQPRISDLMRGKYELFSTDALVTMLGLSGAKLDVDVRPD